LDPEGSTEYVVELCASYWQENGNEHFIRVEARGVLEEEIAMKSVTLPAFII
jgi:hypothetical protein